jgi:hypothetical protein
MVVLRFEVCFISGRVQWADLFGVVVQEGMVDATANELGRECPGRQGCGCSLFTLVHRGKGHLADRCRIRHPVHAACGTSQRAVLRFQTSRVVYAFAGLGASHCINHHAYTQGSEQSCAFPSMTESTIQILSSTDQWQFGSTPGQCLLVHRCLGRIR